ncbi:hypothetical protein WP12_12235 [Sphingomonas sp. SRS2]|nr:hypothetical protein WP12_12235 [Sphingomonas sp. SRS2]
MIVFAFSKFRDAVGAEYPVNVGAPSALVETHQPRLRRDRRDCGSNDLVGVFLYPGPSCLAALFGEAIGAMRFRFCSHPVPGIEESCRAVDRARILLLFNGGS